MIFVIEQGFSKSLWASPQIKLGKSSIPGCLWIVIMLFDPIDTQQLSQDSLILLFDITSDNTKYIKKVCPKAFISFWESGKNSKIPQNYCIS